MVLNAFESLKSYLVMISHGDSQTSTSLFKLLIQFRFGFGMFISLILFIKWFGSST